MNALAQSAAKTACHTPTKAYRVFATSPQSSGVSGATYLQEVIKVAQWSESAGCAGTLIYTDNSIVDPWLVAQAILLNTNELIPLIAVQPLYLHPYAAAKMIATLGYMHGRRVILNMVAGGFKNDLLSLGDQTPHDSRYERLVEYVQVVKLLLSSGHGVTFRGRFFQLENATLKPDLPAALQPEFFISGSSEAGLAAADAVGAVPIKYPEPLASDSTVNECPENSHAGIRVGIIARQTASEAWAIAEDRFPFDRRGQIAHQMAVKVSDSVWHKQMSSYSEKPAVNQTYWLGPFHISKSNCPYLVGSYTDVAAELRRYLSVGYSTFILDIPPSADELSHTAKVFEEAQMLMENEAL